MTTLDNSTPIEPTLRRVFGHEALRPSQERALAPILEGRDTVVVMPTGTGKSLCYQLPGALEDGLTVVVSPLISLMKDQVDGLRRLRLAAGTLNSSQPAEAAREVYRDLYEGRLRFLYVAPERLAHDSLAQALGQNRVARVAVDEAHCVSTWGHDFRPDYLRVADFVAALGQPQTLALTATATPVVREDIARALRLREPALVVTGFDRPNLSFDVVRARGQAERTRAVLEAFRGFAGGAALVYAGSRRNTEQTAAALRDADLACEVYHAGLAAAERTRVQERFMSGEASIVVATNAFGMGIDRADVRLVVHVDVPGSLEAYYQEIGRAGRDGDPARAVLVFSEGSVRLQEFFVDRAHPGPALIHRVWDALRHEGGPADGRELEARFEREEQPRVAASLSRLHGAGLAGRTQDGRVFAVDASAELEGRLDVGEMRRRREIDEAKLRAVAGYARRRTCRRNAILDYFEAEYDGEPCGRCDVCCAGTAPGRKLGGPEVVELQKLLSGVARCRGRAGRQKIVLMLAGSQAREVAGTWLQELSTYGILRPLKRDAILERLDAAVDAGLVEIVGDQYPVLRVTPAGWEVLKGGEPPELAWPGGARPARPVAAGVPEEDDEVLDQELLERIRRWRHERAEDQGVPAYCVFGNRTLEDIVRRRPRSLEELGEVYGFGPSRTEALGPEILELCQ